MLVDDDIHRRKKIRHLSDGSAAAPLSVSSLSSLFGPENLKNCMAVRAEVERAKVTESDMVKSKNYADTKPLRVRDFSPENEKSIDKAKKKMLKLGMVILDPIASRFASSLLPLELLSKMQDGAKSIEKAICDRLYDVGIDTKVTRKSKSMSREGYDLNYKFQEVSSRCLGRLDVRYGMTDEPFNDPLLGIDAPWLPLIHKLLGSDAELKYSGLIFSFPGSLDQPYHGDGPHLFGNSFQCPPHAINVFIPLCDIDATIGPTEFIATSHLLENAQTIHQLLKASSTGELGTQTAFTSVRPFLTAGSVMMYEYRLIHRGTRNSHPTKCRHMFYMLYAKPWFQENINFGDVSLFSAEAVTAGNAVRNVKHEDATSAGYCNMEDMR